MERALGHRRPPLPQTVLFKAEITWAPSHQRCQHSLIPGTDKTFSKKTAPAPAPKTPGPNAPAPHPTFRDQPGSLTYSCTCPEPCFHLHPGPHPGLSQSRARVTSHPPTPDPCPSLAQVSCPLPQSFSLLRPHLLSHKVPTLVRSVRVPTHCRIPQARPSDRSAPRGPAASRRPPLAGHLLRLGLCGRGALLAQHRHGVPVALGHGAAGAAVRPAALALAAARDPARRRDVPSSPPRFRRLHRGPAPGSHWSVVPGAAAPRALRPIGARLVQGPAGSAHGRRMEGDV